MAKNKKTPISDKVAGFLFEEIIDILVKRYEACPEKDTKSFLDFCIELKNLSREKRGKKGVTNDSNP